MAMTFIITRATKRPHSHVHPLPHTFIPVPGTPSTPRFETHRVPPYHFFQKGSPVGHATVMFPFEWTSRISGRYLPTHTLHLPYSRVPAIPLRQKKSVCRSSFGEGREESTPASGSIRRCSKCTQHVPIPQFFYQV